MAQQTAKIPLPNEYSETVRESIAEDVIDFIQSRTKSGLDVDGSRFAGYSESYKKSLDFKNAEKNPDQVNLTLTGDMLASIELIENIKGKITVGFRDGTFENDKADWNQNGRVERKFLGISDQDLNKILKRYPIKEKDKLLENVARVKMAEAVGDILKIKNWELFKFKK